MTAMTTLFKPSALIPKGLRVQQIKNLALLKFTDELGDRMQALLDKKKGDSLTSDEILELEAIGELDEIFSYVNAVMTATTNFPSTSLLGSTEVLQRLQRKS
jgi:hypothetical protein